MKRRGVRRLVGGATVALLGLCLSSQGVAAAAPSATGVTAASGVTMTVDAGWNGVYRGQPAWTPIRVAFQNQNSESVAGTVEILDTSIADAVQSGRRAVADYDQSVLLPAGQARRVTLYVPGADLNGQVTVTFRVGGRALLSTTVFPTALRDTDLTIAAVTSQPQSLAWLHQLRLPGTRVVAASLDPSALDPLPEALASFDLIVISNVNAAQLDQDQLVALDRYVRNGGSVLLVGGPDWAETLAPLGQLLPGSLTGSRIEPGLPGLASLGEGEPPPRPTTVSRLAPGSGAILAGDASLPLVVRAPRGNGTIQYLAFDPSVEPIPHWSGAERLLSGLVRGAMTQAMRRLTLPDGYGSVSFLKPAGGEVDAAREIAGLPSASPTVLLILAGITTLYVLLAGPVGFAALRRARRPALTWMAVPALSLVFGTGVIGVATQAKGRALAVNTIGMVQLDGPADRYPGTFYVGLTVPGPGRYRLTYDRPALASPSLPDTSTAQTPSARATTPEWRLDEGVQPGITLPVTDDWTERAAAVRTAVDAAGTVSANLHLDAQGDVVGTIHNGTRLTLLHPVAIAGRASLHLPDARPGATIPLHIRPWNDPLRHDYQDVLPAVYGRVADPETASQLGDQSSLADQIRLTVAALPQAHLISMLGEVLLVAWTQDPLAAVRVDGSGVAQNNLSLLVSPLTVGSEPGPLALRRGTLAASLVDEVPAPFTYPCCTPSAQSIFIGAGGSATFEFDLPAPGRVRFRKLALSVWAGGPDPSYTGYTDMPGGAGQAYDWRSRRWVDLSFAHGAAQLSNPDRFIEPTGALLVRLRALDDTHELTLADPHQDLQISGSGTVR